MRNSKTSIKHLFLTVVLLCVFLTGAHGQQDIDGMLQLIQAGKQDSARILLKELGFDNPGHPGIRYARALMEADALVAAGIYKDIIRNHPRSKYMAGSLMRLGEYYYAQGLYVQSRQQFMRLIRFHQGYPEIIHAVNLSLRAGIASRQMDSTYIDLREIVQLYPQVQFDIPEELDLTRLPGVAPAGTPENQATPQVVAPIRTLGSDIQAGSTKPQAEFTLQAGAFGSYENARRLADQIESIGYTTRIKERRSNGKTLHLILVGEYSDRTAAMSAADLLEAALGVDSFPVAIN